MTEAEFKEKARRHMFNCHLNVFPTVFELYVRAFNLGEIDVDASMTDIIEIIRTSADANTAYELTCHYLDTLE